MSSSADEPRGVPSESQAQKAWDDAADVWNDFVETGLDYYRTELHGPALLEACLPAAGVDALDLGCGQGWFSRQLAGQGARVVGIDWSERLVAHARRLEVARPLGITYEALDAARVGDRFAPASFDLVTACMSLMDMPAPGRVLAAARALLRPRGRIVVSVPQPVTDASFRQWERDADGKKLSLKLDRYFDADTQLMDWNVRRLDRHFQTVHYRHTLESWSRMFEGAGLAVFRMREPRPSAEAVARVPELDDARRLPYFLIFDLRAVAP